MPKLIFKISMASKMAAKWNNYKNQGAEEVSFCNIFFYSISCINIVLSYVHVYNLS